MDNNFAKQLLQIKYDIEMLRQRLHFARAEGKTDIEMNIIIGLSELQAQYFNMSSKLLEPLADKEVHVVFGPSHEYGSLMNAEQFASYTAQLTAEDKARVYSMKVEFIPYAEVA